MNFNTNNLSSNNEFPDLEQMRISSKQYELDNQNDSPGKKDKKKGIMDGLFTMFKK